MEEGHSGWMLLRGVRSDITTLLKKVEESMSVSFSDFCKVWQEMKFSLIFLGRNSMGELLEFSEEIIHIAKNYLLPAYNFRTRVGALYTLYALYFKQPIKRAAKIRITKSEWVDLCLFIENCKSEEYFDVVFIHLKLYTAGAYIFTAIPRATGLERGFRKYDEKRLTSGSSSQGIEQVNKPFLDASVVQAYAKLESLYCEKKSELLGEMDLLHVEGNFAEKIKDKLEKYCHGGSSSSQSVDVQEEESDPDFDVADRVEDEDDEEFIGNRRSKLRAKAYANSKKGGKGSEKSKKSKPKSTAHSSPVVAEVEKSEKSSQRKIAPPDKTRKKAKLALDILDSSCISKESAVIDDASNLPELQ